VSTVARAALAIDHTIDALKWPVWVGAVVLMPGALVACLRCLLPAARGVPEHLPFLAGVGAYLIAWMLLFRWRAMGSYLPTFAHELSHAVVALATLHPVTGLHATWRKGGHMTYRGRGNWLIRLAPYFLPVATLSVVAVLSLVPASWRGPGEVVLGVALAFDLVSIARQNHPDQPDQIAVGRPFAFVFLPVAQLLLAAGLLRFVLEGPAGIARVVRDVSEITGWMLPWLAGGAGLR